MITLAPACTMPEESLSNEQQSALTSLVLGKTVSEAAGEAGVHRNTVHRWLRKDEAFQKAKGHLQHDAQAAVQKKLHDTAVTAMECIERCLQEGDAYVAEQLLKGLGCYSGELSSLGSDDAVELAQEALRHSRIAEMLGGTKAESGERNSAQAEGENLQHDAPSDGRSRHAVPDNESVEASQTESFEPTEPPVVEWSPGVGWTDNVDPAFNDNDRWLVGRTEKVQPPATPDGPLASGSERPDLREMERYASVFATPDEEENSQPCATPHDPPAPNFDFRSPTSNPHHAAPSEELAEPSVNPYAELTAQQTLAMFAILSGDTIAEAAEEAETEPATVYAWVNGDYTFQAAMNRCARERRQAIQARLTQLASLAADVVNHKIRHGNGRLAVRLLRGLGYLATRRV